jgi:predicted transposase/invertase (TIGR01784 family)
MESLVRFDWAIKSILRNKANFDILEGFLSALLQEEIQVLNLLESESNREKEVDKLNRVDLLVENSQGELILIEVQVESEADFFHRMAFAAAKLLTEHLKKGEPYQQIKKVIVVAIVYVNLGQGSDYLYHGATAFVGVHDKDLLGFTEEHQARFHVTEVSKIFPEYHVIRVGQFSDQVRDAMDEWVYMLKNSEIKPEFRSKHIQDASEKLRELNLSLEERRAYDSFLQDLSYQASMDQSRWMDGWVAGKSQGEAEGKAEGIEEAKRVIAKTLLAQGVAVAVIVTATGLSLEQLQQIAQEKSA